MNEDKSITITLESTDARMALFAGQDEYPDDTNAELVGSALINTYGDSGKSGSTETEGRDELTEAEREKAAELRENYDIF